MRGVSPSLGHVWSPDHRSERGGVDIQSLVGCVSHALSL